MAFSFVVLAPVAMRESWEVHRAALAKQWKGVVYIGAFMALNIALNNISLLDISLTLNQIIRCVLLHHIRTSLLMIKPQGPAPAHEARTIALAARMPACT